METIMEMNNINKFQKQIQAIEDKFKEELERLNEDERSCYFAIKSAEKKYLADVNNKRGNLSARTSDLSEQLTEITSAIKNLTTEYSNAVQNEDEKREKEISAALDELGTKESLIKRKIDAFSTSSVRGDDALFLDALMAYREHLLAHERLNGDYNVMLKLLTNLQEVAERYLRIVGRDYRSNKSGKRLSELLIEREGISINRHTAGTDEDGMIRFLNAFVMGKNDLCFKGTPAEEKLIENQQTGFFKERENHE
jgi:hypothetical protein